MNTCSQYEKYARIFTLNVHLLLLVIKHFHQTLKRQSALEIELDVSMGRVPANKND